MLVAESRMVMGKAHVFHVGSLSHYTKWQGFVLFFMIEFVDFTEAIGILQVRSLSYEISLPPPPPCVNRRVGGLEMQRQARKSLLQVNRRVGGLEIVAELEFIAIVVNRRVGGLERHIFPRLQNS